MDISYPLDIGVYKSDSPVMAYQDCYNMYPANPQTVGSNSRGGLYSFPGSIEWVETTENSWIGGHLFNGQMYCLGSSGKLYLIGSDQTATVVGTTSTPSSSERAIFADNGVVMCLVLPGSDSYFYDSTNGLVQITDSVFQGYEAEDGGVRSVAFLKGYFVFNTYTKVFNSSLVSVNSGKNFDALDFTQPFLREKCLRVGAVRGELIAMGESTSEFYAAVGTADFPFSKIIGATIDKGVENGLALITFDNSYFFFGSGYGERPSVWRGVGGGGVQKIGTDYIDSVLGSPSYGSATTYAFMLDGRPYIGFYLTNSSNRLIGGTFLYDILTSIQQGRPVWFEIGTGETPGSGWQRGGIIEAYGRIMVLGAQGRIDYLDKTVNYEDNGRGPFSKLDRTCQFSGQYLQAMSKPVYVSRLELIAETGLANDRRITTEDSNPQVQLEYSDDGGRTFTSLGSRSLGLYQEYNARVIWHRLGMCPSHRLFRFKTVNGKPSRFVRIDIDLDQGYN